MSITSTGNTGGRAGNPVSIKDATNTKARKAAPPSRAGDSIKSDSQPDSQNVVKEKPKDEDVGGGNEDFGDYGDGDYGDGNAIQVQSGQEGGSAKVSLFVGWSCVVRCSLHLVCCSLWTVGRWARTSLLSPCHRRKSPKSPRRLRSPDPGGSTGRSTRPH